LNKCLAYPIDNFNCYYQNPRGNFAKHPLFQQFFRRTLEKDILVVQINVDDIIFGSTNASL